LTKQKIAYIVTAVFSHITQTMFNGVYKVLDK